MIPALIILVTLKDTNENANAYYPQKYDVGTFKMKPTGQNHGLYHHRHLHFLG